MFDLESEDGRKMASWTGGDVGVALLPGLSQRMQRMRQGVFSFLNCVVAIDKGVGSAPWFQEL